ncbi:MAG: M48 family metalloprotease [Saprospiraceae bacterium]
MSNRLTSNFGKLSIFFCCAVILCLTSCGRDDDQVVSVDQEEFSAEDRKAISNSLENAIDNHEGYDVINPQATSEMAAFHEYLNRNYQALVNTDRVTNRNDFSWSIHVLDDEESKNAFITPGGAMYITTALLKSIKTEHELIGILAHEISYADGDVLINKLKNQFDGGVLLFEIIQGFNPPELPSMAAALKDISFTEEEVLAADSYAVDIICDFLYDPHGIRDFLKRITTSEEKVDWQINRPSTEDRNKQVELNASGCGPGRRFEDRYQYFLENLQ